MNKKLVKRFGSIMVTLLLVSSIIMGDVIPVNAETLERLESIIDENQETGEIQTSIQDESESIEETLSNDETVDKGLISNDTAIEQYDDSELIGDGPLNDENGEDFNITADGVNFNSGAYTTYNPFSYGECTWYAWGRAKEKLNVELPCRSHAKDWLWEAEGSFQTGDTPRSNSIMVMGPTCGCSSGFPGHVVFVESVNGNTMTVTEGNSSVKANGEEYPVPVIGKGEKNTHYWNCASFHPYEVWGFIYLDSVSQSPVGHIDSASGGDGKINIGGWAYDPDSTSTKIQVNLYIEGISGPVASFKTHIYRQIAGGTYCGFAETIDVSKYNLKGKKKIHLWGIDVTGDENAEIGTAEITMGKDVTGTQTPIGHLDSASGGVGVINVGGWAYDPDATSTKIQVNLYVDGYSGPVASFKTHIYRQIAGGTYCGFDEKIDVSTYDFSGKKKIYLWGVDATGNENAEIGTAEVTITKKININGVTLNKTATALTVGKTETLTATVAPSNATNKNVTWSSSNTSVATVSSTGVVTAKSTGAATIMVKTSDGGKTATCKVTVGASPTITTTSLPIGEVGKNYSATLTSTGTTPITWSKTAGSLPDGLTIDSSGTISGKPTKAGSFIVTVQAKNNYGNSPTKNFTITISGVAPKITTKFNNSIINSIKPAEIGKPYTFTFTADGTLPLKWSVVGGTSLPDGLALITSTGQIYGTPSTIGGKTFRVRVENEYGYDEKEIYINVYTNVPSIVTESLPDGVVGEKYAAYIDTTNHDGNDKMSNLYVSEGTHLDEWLNDAEIIDNGFYIITGVPKKAGKFIFTLTVENSYGKSSKEFTVNVGASGNEKGNIGIVGITDKEYSGNPITQTFEVYDVDKLLNNSVDYSVKYANNTKAYTLSVGDPGFDARKAPSITITGKGNYSNKETVYFRILPQDISGIDFNAYDMALVYNKKSQKAAPALYWKGSTLKNGTDYTVDVYRSEDIGYSTSLGETVKDVGDYIVRLTGKGNFTGVREVGLKVSSDHKPVSKLSVGKIANVRYTGNMITPEPVIKDGKTVLVKDTHYALSYNHNIDVGMGYVIVTGIPEAGYSGTRRIEFKITGTALRKTTVSGIQKSYTYTGNEITINDDTLKLYIKATEKAPQTDLVKDRDYTVSYLKNTNAGTATVVLTGMGGYTGSVKKTVRIMPFKLAEDNGGRFAITCADTAEYSKAGAKPEMAVTFKNADGTVQTLTPGTDYTLSYKNNTSVNGTETPTVIVKGKGNYAGSRSVVFAISKKDLNKITISAADKTYRNKAGAYKTTVTLTDNGKKLTAGKDYDKTVKYTYVNNTEVQTGNGAETRMAGEEIGANDIVPQNTLIRVTASAADTSGYTGTGQCTYRITRSSIGSAKISVPAQMYTGKEVKPTPESITVKVGETVLRPYNEETGEGDFIITGYTNNVKKGTAKLTIQGTGNYGGTKTASFTIGARVMR